MVSTTAWRSPFRSAGQQTDCRSGPKRLETWHLFSQIALLYEALHRSHADLQTHRRLVHADDLLLDRRGIEDRYAQTFAKFAHTRRRPGFPHGRPRAHSVERDGQLPVGPLPAQLPHDFDRTGRLWKTA